MNFATAERAALCDDLLRLGPAAPTLCEGWTAYDLAAHLWTRETDPLAAPGIAFQPLAGLTRRRLAECRQRHSFPSLVGLLRRGPAAWSLFALPGVDEIANTMELFIHHEDLRRAQVPPPSPRPLPAELETMCWHRLRLLARPLLRRSPVGVVLERSDESGQSLRAVPGDRIVTLVGLPSELLLWAAGRGRAADVRAIGEPAAVAALHGADRSL